MRISIIRAVFNKELRFVLRDKKALFTMIAMPLILFPAIFAIVTLIISGVTSSSATDAYRIAAWQLEEPVQALLENSETNFVLTETEDYTAALSEGEADAALIYRDGAYTIAYCSATMHSDSTYNLLQNELDAYADGITEETLRAAGLDPEDSLDPLHLQTEDLSSGEETMGSLMGMIVPMMLILGVFSGAQMLAVDTTAGERDRNTQETLMTLPISGRELITGKFLTVALYGMVSALLYMVSLIFIGGCVIKMIGILGGTLDLDIFAFGPALLVVVLAVMAFALLLSAALMCLCSFAKSTKEAAGYVAPLMIIVLLVSYTGMADLHLTPALSVVPVLNIVMLIKSVLIFEYDILAIVLVLVSNVAYAAIAITILGKLYTSERILFGEKDGSLLERRSKRIAGAKPTLGDGILTLIVTLLIYLYVSIMTVQATDILGGTAIGLIIVGGVCLLAAWYGRVDLRATFSLKKPEGREWLPAVVLGIGGFLLCNGILRLVGPLFPDSAENFSESLDALMGSASFPVKLLVVALLPAVCEELLFRGYTLSALQKPGRKAWTPIVISSILFGAYHMNLYQGVYACLMGLLLAWVLYRTGSILCTALMHFLANGISVVLSDYGETLAEKLPALFGNTWLSVLLWVIFGGALTALGAWLLLRKNSKAVKVS